MCLIRRLGEIRPLVALNTDLTLVSLHPEQRLYGTSAILCIAVIKPSDPSELPHFKSFVMGGFECATHRRRDRSRIDVLARTKHDLFCATDYRLLAQAGLRTVRDGLRWHLIEKVPGTYDWSSFLPMLSAAHANRTQVIWDLCHWGIPDWLDIFSDDFVPHFTNFSIAAATLIREAQEQAGCTDPPFYAPINEISFWAWVGGDEQHFHPFAAARGNELKKQLVRASIAAIRAVRVVQPNARFVQPEPLIHISVNPRDTKRDLVADAVIAAAQTAAQFDTWDMLSGVCEPELGGSSDLLDIVGVNYYWNNQWTHAGPPTPAGHLEHRALHVMLHELSQRYQRPVLITETGAEAGAGAGWLAYIGTEVRQAQRMGTPILGLCIYPVMDYPGWDDDRHCHCGLIECSADWSARRLRADLLPELQIQQRLFAIIEDVVRP